ncbi:hypothetical protein PDJAM_G00031450 [Pangasius djambal]|uniref:Uncharacterized protein n=1 Tax=Pangasius djambal TaxID=1691987 RepID=A0ACC5YT22_9TELE|nr:hypothetical protein [Pangasius djambal]
MLSSCPSSHSRGDCPMCVGLAGRQRRQTGHTNRWQLAPPLPGDLLGQSQVKRATRSGLCVHTPHRSTRSADTLQQRRDDSPSQQPPPLHAGLWYDAQRACASRRTSQKIRLSHAANPEHAFYIVSQEVVQNVQPDAVLECFGSIWELHCPYLCESETLAELYRNSKKQRHTLLQERTESGVRERCVWRGGRELRLRQDGGMGKSRGSLARPILLQLNINDPLITKECKSRSVEARYYKQASLQQACERWLELFLVTELSHRIDLRDLTFDLLLKTLQCPRVFTSNEYELLRTVLYWIYLQASGIFLEQPLGQAYAPLFQALRLHGITERQHMEEMQKINVFPHSWLHFTFSNLVYSIHSGGNMHIANFSQQAVRFGMTVAGEHCTHTVGLYGFYFLLKASRVGESGAFAFSMERLRHWDPVLAESCRTTQPFSMRAERCVSYQISVQSRVCGEWQERSSGELNQVFGLSRRCCRSKVFTVDGLCVPALVTFSLAFPSA